MKPQQTELPGIAPDIGGTLARKVTAPLKPTKPQEPCDVGLFGDNAAQLDLVEMALKR
jgi:hypothetical protein